MKFPITREALLSFDQPTLNAENTEEDIRKMLIGDIYGICDELKRNMSVYSLEKKFVWRGLIDITRMRTYGLRQLPSIDEYIPHIREKLKRTFIGCGIIIDPLKTYITIDWS